MASEFVYDLLLVDRSFFKTKVPFDLAKFPGGPFLGVAFFLGVKHQTTKDWVLWELNSLNIKHGKSKFHGWLTISPSQKLKSCMDLPVFSTKHISLNPLSCWLFWPWAWTTASYVPTMAGTPWDAWDPVGSMWIMGIQGAHPPNATLNPGNSWSYQGLVKILSKKNHAWVILPW